MNYGELTCITPADQSFDRTHKLNISGCLIFKTKDLISYEPVLRSPLKDRAVSHTVDDPGLWRTEIIYRRYPDDYQPQVQCVLIFLDGETVFIRIFVTLRHLPISLTRSILTKATSREALSTRRPDWVAVWLTGPSTMGIFLCTTRAHCAQ